MLQEEEAGIEPEGAATEVTCAVGRVEGRSIDGERP